MCENCYDSYGAPCVITPDVLETADLIGALYEVCPTGGPLHCALDDWNIDGDGPFTWEREHMRDYISDGEDGEEEVRRATAVLDKIDAMTVAERATALAIHWGYITREGKAKK